MATKFQGELPNKFYETVQNEIVTAKTIKKGVRIGDKTVYESEKFNARMLVTGAERDQTSMNYSAMD